MQNMTRTTDLHREVFSATTTPTGSLDSLKRWFNEQWEKHEQECELREKGEKKDADGRRIPLTEAAAMQAWSHFLNTRATNGVAGHRSDTALAIAVKKNHEGAVHFLLKEAGVSPNAPDVSYSGLTPLMVVAMRPNFDQRAENLMRMLLHGGALPNAQCKSRGRTALHYAIERNNLVAVAILLEHGANPWVPDRNGEVPMHTVLRLQRNHVLARNLWDWSVEHVSDHFRRVATSRMTNYKTAPSLLATAAQRTGAEWDFVRKWQKEKLLEEDELRRKSALQQQKKKDNDGVSAAGAGAAAAAAASTESDDDRKKATESTKMSLREQRQEEEKFSTILVSSTAVATVLLWALPSLIKMIR